LTVRSPKGEDPHQAEQYPLFMVCSEEKEQFDTFFPGKEQCMLERATVAAWLDAYVQAWKTYDPAAIGNLFSEDASYAYDPFSEPVRGRAAIVASWLEHQDTPGTYDGQYEPLLLASNQVVANGRSRYFEPDGSTLRAEWDNLFVLRFDDRGRCSDYREWYMPRPKEQAE
jgi:hypothetical protein